MIEYETNETVIEYETNETVWLNMKQHGTVWLNMKQHGTVWLNMKNAVAIESIKQLSEFWQLIIAFMIDSFVHE